MKIIRFLFAIMLLWSQFSDSAAAAFLGPAATDEGTFTAGTSPFQPGGCFFQTTATSNPLTTGQQGTIQCTANRAPFVNLRDTAGAALGTSSNPLFFSLNATPSLVNGNGVVPTQGGSVLSATNGTFDNLLQGNAVLSATNGIYTNLLQGNAVLSATNPIFVAGAATGSAVPSNSFYNGVNVGGTLRGWTAVNPSGTVYAGQVDLTSIAGTTTVTGGVSGSLGVGGLAASGSAVAGNPVLMGGSDGTNARSMATDTSGHPIMVSVDPCSSLAKTSVAISQTASAQLFAGTSAKNNYICSIMALGADAENMSLIGGTGTVCATSSHAYIGSTTAANGPNFAANGGFVAVAGNATVVHGTTTAENVCLLQSGSGRIAGWVTYVQN